MDYIRSKDVKDYLKKQNYVFSDDEKETIRYISGDSDEKITMETIPPYISFPYPFVVGDVVRDVRTGRVGIITALAPTPNPYMDYSDFSLTVEFENGYHEHIFPGDLEYK